MIEIKNLTKSYGDNTVLKNVNLTIPTGSIFGLVGINGAGKSTLLRLLAGVLDADMPAINLLTRAKQALGLKIKTPTTTNQPTNQTTNQTTTTTNPATPTSTCCQILIDGEEIYDNERKKREILFLPDDPFYSPLMTANDLVKLFKAFYDFDEEVFARYMNIFRLSAASPLRSFSKGMKRQVFVCIAFASAVRYMFLDEVFDGLDPASRLIFRRGLVDWAAKYEGTAVISSHSLRELEDICDSYAIIDGQKIISSGNLSGSLESIHKFNIATKQPLLATDLGFESLYFVANGRVSTIIAEGARQEILDKIARLEPLLIDELPIDFEEFFVIHTQKQTINIGGMDSSSNKFDQDKEGRA